LGPDLKYNILNVDKLDRSKYTLMCGDFNKSTEVVQLAVAQFPVLFLNTAFGMDMRTEESKINLGQ